MYWIIGILLGLMILIVLVFWTKLTIYLSFYHGNDNDDFSINIKAWGGLIRYKIEIPLIKVDDDSPSIVVEEVKSKNGNGEHATKNETSQITPKDLLSSLHDMRELLLHIVGFHKIVRSFLAKIKVDNLEWQTLIGTGDSSSTGIAVGGIWSVKSTIVSIMSKAMKLQSMPVLTVHPSFQQPIIQTKFTCMIQFRIGQAILGGIKIIRYWRGGKARFKTKPLSKFADEKQSV
ncbi:DUF2953 domain-containing protein [Bacillus sp. 2205SS5-2]|uniref:DUF2953 domain-containing protein n=1 Tax=Bacillus sp. 2205SS5-2 TaxID=3109031 RepID=UPI003006B851